MAKSMAKSSKKVANPNFGFHPLELNSFKINLIGEVDFENFRLTSFDQILVTQKNFSSEFPR